MGNTEMATYAIIINEIETSRLYLERIYYSVV
jgi:hypothetical protein